MRCIRPGVPGSAHGLAKVSGSRQVGPEHLGAVGHDLVELGGKLEVRRDVMQIRDVGDQPRLGPIGEVPIREQYHRGPVLQGDPGGFDGHVKTVAGSARGKDRQRSLTVPAEYRVQQVRLLGLSWQACRRAAALDVNDQKR